MTHWEHVKQDLKRAGYSGFEFDSGETAVPGLSGEWVVGTIPREEELKHENQPLWIRILALPGRSAVDAAPENAPERIRNVAAEHGLDVVILSVSADEARVALCDPAKYDL